MDVFVAVNDSVTEIKTFQSFMPDVGFISFF